jgi:hypothetical protein
MKPNPKTGALEPVPGEYVSLTISQCPDLSMGFYVYWKKI